MIDVFKKGKRKVQGVPQSQTAAFSDPKRKRKSHHLLQFCVCVKRAIQDQKHCLCRRKQLLFIFQHLVPGNIYYIKKSFD